MISNSEFIQKLKPASRKIIGRDQEIKEISEILCRAKKHHPILIGERGTGRLSIIKGFVQSIEKNETPKHFSQFAFEYLDIERLLLSERYSEEVLYHLTEIAYQKNTHKILVLDKLDINNMGDDERLLAYQTLIRWVKNILLKEELTLILLCDPLFFEHFLETDTVFRNYGETITITQFSKDALIEILKNRAPEIRKKYQLSIQPEVYPHIIALSQRYLSEMPLFSAIIYLLDAAAAYVYVDQKAKQLTKKQVSTFMSEKFDIELEALLRSEPEKMLTGMDYLEKQIYGHRESLELILQTLQEGYLGLHTANQPLATMLFAGVPYAGKTITAYALAKLLYGTWDVLFEFDLLDYQDSELLIEDLVAVLGESPYSVCLFRNINLASPEMIQTLTLMLNGRLVTDCDLKNTIFIMMASLDLQMMELSNESVAQEVVETELNLIQFTLSGFPEIESGNKAYQMHIRAATQQIQTALTHKLGSDLLRQCTIVPFLLLSSADIKNFILDELTCFDEQLMQSAKVHLVFDENFVQDLVELLPEEQHTVLEARLLIKNHVLPAISFAIAQGQHADKNITSLYLNMDLNKHCICDWEGN